ncbi:MAG: glycosyltransferase [Nanoarchaeota archaeon]
MPTISLCMIARNEEDCIAESLNSVKGLVDEVIVVDNGSTDKTKEIAKKCGAHVFEHTWKDDFSESRNVAIGKAKGDWILVLDADEVIAKKDHDRIKKLIENKDIEGYILLIRTYTAERRLNDWYPSDDYKECKSYLGYIVEQPLRLFRNKKGYLFTGKVHESITSSIQQTKGMIGICQVPIHHYGNVRKKDKMHTKQKSYIHIAREELKKNKEDVKTRYELAIALIQQDQYGQAREHLEQIKKRQPEYKNTLLFLAETYTREGKLDEAIQIYHEFIAYQPNNPTPWTNIGLLYRVQNKLDMALRYLKKALTLNSENAALYEQLSEILMIKGETDKARQLLELGLRHGRYPTHLNNLAFIYLMENKKEEAKKLLQEAQEKLNQLPKEVVQGDPLLKQTLEKVEKNLKKLNS